MEIQYFFSPSKPRIDRTGRPDNSLSDLNPIEEYCRPLWGEDGMPILDMKMQAIEIETLDIAFVLFPVLFLP